MCSVSWVETPDGYHLVFNRDERNQRQPARPPAVFTRNGMAWIAPSDGDFGGTWLAVNAAGLTFGLVNFYPEPRPAPPAAKQSRGFLIPALAVYSDPDEAAGHLAGMDLSVYEPFELLIYAGRATGSITRWDGTRREIRATEPSENPLASSSFVTRPVVEYRRRLFNAMQDFEEAGIASQLRFHTEKRHPDPAYNPCMFRPDARTVSISTVRVTPETISMTYYDQAGVSRWDERPALLQLERQGAAG